MIRSRLAAAVLLWVAAGGPAAAAPEVWTADGLGQLFDGSVQRRNTSASPVSAANHASPAKQPVPEPAAAAPGTADPKRAASGTQEPPPPDGDKPATPRTIVIPIEDSDWTQVGQVSDALSPANPSAREKTDFWDKLRNQSLWSDLSDELCREAKIPLKYRLRAGDYGSIAPEFTRYLRTGVDGRVNLIDRATLGLNMGYGRSVFSFGDGSSLSLYFGTHLEGVSMVIRPLKTKRYCKELDELIDLRDIKAVLPLDADRFAAMQEGEIWNLPIRFSANVGAGVGFAPGSVPLSVSFGYSRQGSNSVSLRRLDAKTLRLRVRIDYMRAYGPSGGLVYSVYGSEFEQFRNDGRDLFTDGVGDLTGKFAFKEVNRQLGRQFERYLVARLTWMAQWFKEDHAVIEYLLDPGDKAAMKALEDLLAGGNIDVLDTLGKMSREAGSAFLHLEEMNRKAEALQEAYAKAFEGIAGAARTFVGAERVTGFLTSIRLKIPLLADLNWGWGDREEKVSIMDDDGGEYRIYRAHSESTAKTLDLPFVGAIINYNTRRSVMSYTHSPGNDKASPPTIVYVHQEGYTNQQEPSARSLILKADSIMRLAGVRGRGENSKAGLPVEKIFPAAPTPPASSGSGDRTPYGARVAETHETFYRRGAAAFTMILGEKAIADILSASAPDVVRAYVLAYDHWDKATLRAVLAKGRMLRDGTVEYGESDIEVSGTDERREEHNRLRDNVRINFHYAKKLAQRLAEIRRMRPTGNAAGQAPARRQTEAIRDLIAGSVGWGLSYEDIMRILVQLTDAKNISAEFIVSAQPYDKKDPKREGRYLLHRGFDEDPQLRRLSETIGRFAGPSQHSD